MLNGKEIFYFCHSKQRGFMAIAIINTYQRVDNLQEFAGRLW
jgi:hypothetical protein